MALTQPTIVPRRLPAEERREQIIRTAIVLAAEHGVDGVTTQEMADALGLTQGAIFRHYPTKDAIWDDALNWIRTRLMSALQEAAAGVADPLLAIEAMFLAHIGFVRSQPAIPRLVFSGYLNRRSDRFRQFIEGMLGQYRVRLGALLETAVQRGSAVAGLDVQAAATLYFGMVQGLVLQATLMGEQYDLPQQARRVFPLFLAAIGAHPETAPANTDQPHTDQPHETAR